MMQTRDMSGTMVMQEIERRSGNRWRPSPGSVYPILDDLLGRGLIELVSTDGRERTYRITAKGNEHLQNIARDRDMLEERAVTGPRFWLSLVEPGDRARILLNIIDASVREMRDILPTLRSDEAEEVVREMRNIILCMEARTVGHKHV
ncbi:MAG: PadR family transcriptional regulator [Candidatus Thorarchaeota archaeon]